MAAEQPVGNKFKPPLLGITEGNPEQSEKQSENEGFFTLRLRSDLEPNPRRVYPSGSEIKNHMAAEQPVGNPWQSENESESECLDERNRMRARMPGRVGVKVNIFPSFQIHFGNHSINSYGFLNL